MNQSESNRVLRDFYERNIGEFERDTVAQDYLILEALRMLYNRVMSGGKIKHGICHNVDMIIMREFKTYELIQVHLYLCEYWVTWPHYSGNSSYPIPEWYDPEDNWIGVKRERRIDLIEHLINCYEIDLEED